MSTAKIVTTALKVLLALISGIPVISFALYWLIIQLVLCKRKIEFPGRALFLDGLTGMGQEKEAGFVYYPSPFVKGEVYPVE
jgi:hypothetical protein